MSDSSQAFNLLSPGMQAWVAKQGWPGFRDVQSAAITALLEDPDNAPNIIVSAPTSAGKALADYEPVLTDSGWKPIGKLCADDKVYGSDGKPHNILGIFPQGEKELYRVTLADGRFIDCSADHIWRVIDKDNGNLVNKTINEIASEQRDNTDKNRQRFAIPNCCPIVPLDNKNNKNSSFAQAANDCLYMDIEDRHRLLEEYLNGRPLLEITDIVVLARSLGKTVKVNGHHISVIDTSSADIIDITDVCECVPMTCIAVDSPDHTYITKDFTVTHNTESAFLPALSIIERYRNEHPTENFVNLLWVSPLKALLNSSFTRLQSVCENAEIPCYLWHGDAPQGQKKEMLRNHDGIILTTPESLESFLVNRGEWCGDYMTPLVVVIDEFHAFLGAGRGKQMLSLLDRIDMINAQHGRKPALRIGLSATLSQLDTVAAILSPRGERAVIDGTGAKGDVLDICVKTFEPPVKREGQKGVAKEDNLALGHEIIEGSVGEKTLTFATSRMQVESIASAINDICKAENIPSEAFPHHGSLAKELREDLERRLVNTDKPTMAVATITLELGIDIGDIYKVFQVGAPNSVASLRQRIGRSGRRDGHKRCECLITASTKPADMEKDLVNIIAEIELMNAGWFEPPQNKRRDASVLVGQILSVVKQYDSAYEEDLYGLLSKQGAFYNIPEDLFYMVVGDMLSRDFLERTSDGMLMLGIAGEREVADYHFYASFSTETAFSVKSGGKTIGEIIPPDTSLMMLNQGGTFMLGGRYWQVIPPIDMKAKVINVRQVASKAKFLVPTSRGAGEVGGKIKQVALQLLCGKLSSYVPDYIDDASKEKLAEAREYARTHLLNGLGISIYDGGENGSETDSEVMERAAIGYNPQALLSIAPPVDKGAYDAIVKILMFAGMEDPSGLSNMPMWRMDELVEAALSQWNEIETNRENLLDPAMLAELREREKYNWILDDETLRYTYIDEVIDLAGAKKWLEAYTRFSASS